MKLHQLFVALPALLLAFLANIAPAHATRQPAVAILPFEVHAEADSSHLGRGIADMLASRLSAGAGVQLVALTEAQIVPPKNLAERKALAASLRADYLITGSVTRLGKAISIDAALTDCRAAVPQAQSFFASAKRDEELLEAVQGLASAITGQLKASVSMPGQKSEPPAAPVAAAKQVGHAILARSERLTMNLLAMESADLDGDGRDEIILGSDKEVRAFKQENGSLVLLFTLPVPTRFKVHAVHGADLDGNGRKELYISTSDVNEVRSFGGEWQGGRFVYRFRDQRWHVRPIARPGQPEVLVGQRSASDIAFAGPLFLLALAGDELVAGDRLPVPKGVNIFDFNLADIDQDGGSEIISIDQNDRLKVWRQDGKLLWKSDEHYGGTARFVGGRDQTARQSSGFSTEDNPDPVRLYLPSRIIVADINRNGRPDIVINRNPPDSSRAFVNLKSYPSARVVALEWNGFSLVTAWEGEKIEAELIDYQLDSKAGSPVKIVTGLSIGGDWFSSGQEGQAMVVTYGVSRSDSLSGAN